MTEPAPKSTPDPKKLIADLVKEAKPTETVAVPATALPEAEVVKPLVVVADKLPSLTLWGAIRTPSQGPSDAMEAKFTCDTCKRETIVKIAWNATAIQRQTKMKEALDLHRVLCTVGLPEDARIYRIHYPRGMIDRLHKFGGVSFGGVPMAQYYCDLYLWEAVLNDRPDLKGIVELGTWQGGMSRYLYAQAQTRGIDFITYDSIQPDNPPPGFNRLDIYRYAELVGFTARAMEGPVALFCDGGNKPRELKTFPPLMPKGSIIAVHDWGTETVPSDVPGFLEELYGSLCDELGSVTRMFKMREEEDGEGSTEQAASPDRPLPGEEDRGRLEEHCSSIAAT